MGNRIQLNMNQHKLDVLAFAAHPDDVELCAGGTMCLLNQQGYKTGIVDFTEGELGSRGTIETRYKEADVAGQIMGIQSRENLQIQDGNIENNPENRLKVVRMIRKYRPHILLINPMECRHPDHGNAAQLSVDAVFSAGLIKVVTHDDAGNLQKLWRPNHILHYMQALDFVPSFVLDISDVWDERVKAIQAYKTQFFDPNYVPEKGEPETYISSPAFMEWVEARAKQLGYRIGAKYAEGFKYYQGPFGVSDLMKTLARGRVY